VSVTNRTCGRVAYVMKVYPRFSETFIVNEILAHEAAGLEVDIFSLRPPQETHFQDAIARVRGGVTYLPDGAVKAETFWQALRDAAALPGFHAGMAAAQTASATEVHAALALARTIRPRAIVHVHAHFASAATTVARIAAAFAGVTYSFTAHAKDIFHESVRHDDLLQKLADAAAAITVSDYNVKYLRQRFGAVARGVRHVNNGLELKRFPYRPPVDDRRGVVAVGRLVEKKGFSTLIDACALLKDRGVAVECEVIGGGELESALRTQIARLGLHEWVSLTGPQPQSAVVQAVSNASVLAMPCVVGGDGNRDGLPTVLLEAMALGTPCVSTDVTGIPEVIQHDRTGLIVPQHDAEALAAAIEQLLEDATRRRRLAAAAREQIDAKFDSCRTAQELRAIFAACVSSRAQAALGA
jgi:colanic acid/amylovoran biosynthesis glycosyltransferase